MAKHKLPSPLWLVLAFNLARQQVVAVSASKECPRGQALERARDVLRRELPELLGLPLEAFDCSFPRGRRGSTTTCWSGWWPRAPAKGTPTSN